MEQPFIPDLTSGIAQAMALAVLWWRMMRAESDIHDLTERLNDQVEKQIR